MVSSGRILFQTPTFRHLPSSIPTLHPSPWFRKKWEKLFEKKNINIYFAWTQRNRIAWGAISQQTKATNGPTLIMQPWTALLNVLLLAWFKSHNEKSEITLMGFVDLRLGCPLLHIFHFLGLRTFSSLSFRNCLHLVTLTCRNESYDLDLALKLRDKFEIKEISKYFGFKIMVLTLSKKKWKRLSVIKGMGNF